ncbi:hypothetical protein PR048_019641 [Dryococelus australis]|uniref:CCHC-type domain-containing protein n=1 Tax=Dryococelus australis TaxID=614101 RepID=A0ABQ9H424_9NEOP|nr:hypothetical protein PR048_019641 [Dryococelus australis]
MFCIHQSQTTTNGNYFRICCGTVTFVKRLQFPRFCETVACLFGWYVVSHMRDFSTKPELILDKMVKLSLAFEAANKNVETILAVQNEIKQISGCNTVDAQSCDYLNCKKDSSKVNALKNTDITCFRCRVVWHKAPGCWYRNSICSKCHKVGHLKKVCRSANGEKMRAWQVLKAREEHYEVLYSVNSVIQIKPYRVHIQLNGRSREFEVGSGATLTIINYKVFESLWPNVNDRPKLTPCTVNLAMWGGKHVHVHGQASVTVGYKGKHCVKDIVVADSG